MNKNYKKCKTQISQRKKERKREKNYIIYSKRHKL